VGDEQDDRIVGVFGGTGVPAFLAERVRGNVGVVDVNGEPRRHQALHHVPRFAVARVGDVFFECEAEDEDSGGCCSVEGRHDLFRDEAAHAFVRRPASRDDVRVYPELPRLLDEVIRVDADAVAADEPGGEAEEIPLRRRGVEDVLARYPQLRAHHGNLVDVCNVKVALGVLDGFRHLCDFDGRRTVDPGRDDGAIEVDEGIRRLRVLPRDDFHDCVDRVCFVSRVDAFGGVAQREIHTAPQPRCSFEDRSADILGHTRVHRRFIDDDCPFLQMLTDCMRRVLEHGQVRFILTIDGGRHGHNDNRRFFDDRWVIAVGDPDAVQFFRRELSCSVMAVLQVLYALAVDIVSVDGVPLPREGGGEGEADVAESHNTERWLMHATVGSIEYSRWV